MLAKLLLLQLALQGGVSQQPKTFDQLRLTTSYLESYYTNAYFMPNDEGPFYPLCSFSKDTPLYKIHIPGCGWCSDLTESDAIHIRFANRDFGLRKGGNLGIPTLGKFADNIPPLVIQETNATNPPQNDAIEKQHINANGTYSQVYYDFGNRNVRYYDPVTQDSFTICRFNKSYEVALKGTNKTFSTILVDLGNKQAGGLTLLDPKSGTILNVAKKFALLPSYALKPYTPPAPTPDLKKEMQRTQQAEQKSKSHQQFVSKFQSRGNKK